MNFDPKFFGWMQHKLDNEAFYGRPEVVEAMQSKNSDALNAMLAEAYESGRYNLKKIGRITKRTAPDVLRSIVPKWGQKALEKVLAGDSDAALSLVVATTNRRRGHVVKCLWKMGAPPAVLREALDSAWNHDHVHVWNAFRYDDLVEVFKAAQFPTSHLPETFVCWRGGQREHLNHGFDLSWTLNRDLACWFAVVWSGEPAGAAVLRRTVRREDVLAHITSRNEDEVLIVPWGRADEDGTLEDWLSAAERHKQTRK